MNPGPAGDPFTIWLTGLSGAGKSTISSALDRALAGAGRRVYVLDGDRLRTGLCSDLGFSPSDRSENLRRAGEVACLLMDAGLVVVAAFISPLRVDRDRLRHRIGGDRFVEVFVNAPIATCEERDPRGLYRKARRGDIPEFTGVSAPYEPPLEPDVEVRTDRSTLEACVDEIVRGLERRGLVTRGRPEPT
jgi:adenylylsulfate kinase